MISFLAIIGVLTVVAVVAAVLEIIMALRKQRAWAVAQSLDAIDELQGK